MKAVSILGESRDSSIICPAGKIGIDCLFGYRGAFIKNIKIEGGEIGIRTQNATPLITGNLIVNNSVTGITSFLTCPIIKNNVIYRAKKYGIYLKEVNSEKSRIRNNIIIQAGYSGIYLDGRHTVSLKENIIGYSKYGINGDKTVRVEFRGHNAIFECDKMIESVDFPIGFIVIDVPTFISPGLPAFNYHLAPGSTFKLKYPSIGLDDE